MSYYLYKITIKNTQYFYYGKSNQKKRLYGHKSDCYKYNGSTNLKLYKKILELNIVKKLFYKIVLEDRILTGLDFIQAKNGEASLINKNIDNPFCLNSRRECMDRDNPKYMEDYREEHKEEIKIKNAKRYINEKVEILKKAEIYRNNNKKKINSFDFIKFKNFEHVF